MVVEAIPFISFSAPLVVIGRTRSKLPTLGYRLSSLISRTTPFVGLLSPMFCHQKKKFRSVNNRVNGLLLDRLRLIAPLAKDGDQVPSDLESSLIAWLTPRIEGIRSE